MLLFPMPISFSKILQAWNKNWRIKLLDHHFITDNRNNVQVIYSTYLEGQLDTSHLTLPIHNVMLVWLSNPTTMLTINMHISCMIKRHPPWEHTHGDIHLWSTQYSRQGNINIICMRWSASCKGVSKILWLLDASTSY